MKIDILWALVASICFGLSGPIAKLALDKGLSPQGYNIIYGVCLGGIAIVSIITRESMTLANCFPNYSSFLYGIIAAIICGIGFIASSHSMAHPDAKISIVIVLFATYPVISSTIGLTFFGEARHVSLPMLITGIVMVIGGGLLVINSIK